MSHPAQALHSESEGAHAERARLNEVVQHLREHLGDSLIAVVLFGSQARGEATPESDWDLLIVAEDLPARTLARYRTVKSFIPTYWRGRDIVWGWERPPRAGWMLRWDEATG